MNWNRLNALLDTLPRTRVGRSHRPAPAFRTCGITGFYLAVIVLLGGGLLAGHSLLVLAGMAVVSAWSFFAYTYLRKWITGREELVLLEHVWFALAANALALWALQVPILAHLDVVAMALCPFLAAGRVGCTLVGCCHGLPSSVGIRYTQECAADGFSRHLVGVRLFPAPAIEGLGLVVIGVLGTAALPVAAPGQVFAWFLLAYAVMRFGLEGIRGDARPHFLGLSQARWMAIAEVLLAVHLGSDLDPVRSMILNGALVLTLAGALIYRWRRDPRRLLLRPSHLRELRDAVRTLSQTGPETQGSQPRSGMTSLKLSLVVSTSPTQGTHLSLRLPGDHPDLGLTCDLVARAFPEAQPDGARFSSGGTFHCRLNEFRGTDTGPSTDGRALSAALFGQASREWQRRRTASVSPLTAGPASLESSPTPAPTTARPLPPTVPETRNGIPRAAWFFRTETRDTTKEP